MQLIPELERKIIIKERQQKQIEEIRSLIYLEVIGKEEPKFIYDETIQNFKNPSELTYLCYLSKPVKSNEQYMHMRREQIVFEVNGRPVSKFDINTLTHIQLGRKNRLNLVFNGHQVYIQTETKRKQLKLHEAFTYIIQNKVFK